MNDGKEIGGLIRALRRVADSYLRDETRRVGITSAEYAVLIGIAADPCIEPTRLADTIAMDRFAFAGVVKRLERKNLVRRGPDPSIHQIARLLLTVQAEELLADVAPGVARALERTYAPLTRREREVFLSLLLRVAGEMRRCH